MSSQLVKLESGGITLFDLYRIACAACNLNEQVEKAFYDIWIEKYCNARINDRLFGKDLTEISETDKISGKTQNLRDHLLTSHVSRKK